MAMTEGGQTRGTERDKMGPNDLGDDRMRDIHVQGRTHKHREGQTRTMTHNDKLGHTGTRCVIMTW